MLWLGTCLRIFLRDMHAGLVVGGAQNLVRGQDPIVFPHHWASLCSWHGARKITHFISQHAQETETIGDVCVEGERGFIIRSCLTQL